MIFTNAGISLENIPVAENMEWQKPEPGLKRVKQCGWFILWLLLFAIWGSLLIFIPKIREPEVWISVSAVLILLCIFQFYAMLQSLRYKAFAIRENDIFYRTGWIIRWVKVVPFNRVQHCSVSAGVFGRWFGVSSMMLFTSGGSAADVKIPGLNPQTANNLRQWILSKIHQDGGGL